MRVETKKRGMRRLSREGSGNPEQWPKIITERRIFAQKGR
jgi:hypothetical protein